MQLVAPENAPESGTFWLLQKLDGEHAEPPLPVNPFPKLPLYTWPDDTNSFLVDDTTVNYDTLKEDVLNHWALKAEDAKYGIETPPVPELGIYGESESFALLLLNELPPPPGTNGSGGSSTNSGWAHASYTSNELWLEMVALTNNTAALTIHPPWYAANGVYDLGYCTDLTPPIDWRWVLRTEPGQTNLVVTNATDAQGFYDLRPLDDLPPDDSLGTNFWLAFYIMYDVENEYQLSLNISSPVGATGMVTIPGLGITNAFSNRSIHKSVKAFLYFVKYAVKRLSNFFHT